jgi:NADH-ubiquinone oxidoreductase chain 4
MILASIGIQQNNTYPTLLSRLFSLLLTFLLLRFSSPQTLPFYIYFEATLIPTVLIIIG